VSVVGGGCAGHRGGKGGGGVVEGESRRRGDGGRGWGGRESWRGGSRNGINFSTGCSRKRFWTKITSLEGGVSDRQCLVHSSG